MRMEDVEAEAGVSRGAQLHHFAAKRDLLLATFAYVNDRSLETKSATDPVRRTIQECRRSHQRRRHGRDGILLRCGFLIEFALVFGNADREIGRLFERRRAAPGSRSRKPGAARWKARGFRPMSPSDLLNLTLNTVRGFALRRFIEDDPKQRTHLVASLAEDDPRLSAGSSGSCPACRHPVARRQRWRRREYRCRGPDAEAESRRGCATESRPLTERAMKRIFC